MKKKRSKLGISELLPAQLWRRSNKDLSFTENAKDEWEDNKFVVIETSRGTEVAWGCASPSSWPVDTTFS